MHDMKKLLQLIKQAASDVYEAKKPCDIMFGKIESTEPFKLNINDRFIVSDEPVIFVEDIKSRLSQGDKVVLIRKSGGQKYLIAGRFSE